MNEIREILDDIEDFCIRCRLDGKDDCENCALVFVKSQLASLMEKEEPPEQLDRKEFLALPMDVRRYILYLQAELSAEKQPLPENPYEEAITDGNDYNFGLRQGWQEGFDAHPSWVSVEDRPSEALGSVECLAKMCSQCGAEACWNRSPQPPEEG